MAKMKMNESELNRVIDLAISDTTAKDSTFMSENEYLLNRYLGNPYGDEKPERSKVVSNDVMDVVEADAPSLIRIFLGSGDILKFKPNKKGDKADVQEAEQKTAYVNWQVKDQEWSFATIAGWIKNALILKAGVVKYYIEDETEVEEHRKTGLNETELAMFYDSLQGVDVKSIDITERGEVEEDGTYEVVFKVKKERQVTKVRNIPLETFLMTRNAESEDDALLVGDLEIVTRGELLARGFKKPDIDKIPLSGGGVGQGSNEGNNTNSRLKDIRDEDEGGSDSSDQTNYTNWALEQVELYDLYITVDYDGDGVPERRHIIRGGQEVILLNEVFNHVPYAVMSSVLMPHKAIGMSRAEVTAPYARNKTAILRGIYDNIYSVNAPRIAANTRVNMDDLLVQRPNGVIRTKDDQPVANNLMPVVTPYIGDKALQVLQYIDQSRAQTTGSLMASQGLQADDLGKETATRFEGVQDASDAKVELVARTMAETGFRKLFQGIAWLNANYQNTPVEIEVLGKELVVNPSDWKFSHSVVSNVGLGIGDDEKLVGIMGQLFQITEQLKAQGSPLVDTKKTYNILSRIVKGLGLPEVSEFYNDPERPEQMVLAENEILRNAVQQLQAQMQQMGNPLAEVEQIKAQAKLIEAQSKAQIDVAKMQADNQQFVAKLEAERRKSEGDWALKLTELEAKFSQELSQKLKENQADYTYNPETGEFV